MRASRFSYLNFVRDNLDNINVPIKPSTLIRSAIDSGAVGSMESVHKGIRMACDSLANSTGYKRIRTPDVSGYQYIKET